MAAKRVIATKSLVSALFPLSHRDARRRSRNLLLTSEEFGFPNWIVTGTWTYRVGADRRPRERSLEPEALNVYVARRSWKPATVGATALAIEVVPYGSAETARGAASRTIATVMEDQRWGGTSGDAKVIDGPRIQGVEGACQIECTYSRKGQPRVSKFLTGCVGDVLVMVAGGEERDAASGAGTSWEMMSRIFTHQVKKIGDSRQD